MTRTELLPEILSLSYDDQLMIAEAIRNHLAGAVASVDETEFQAELQRRVADARLHPQDESPLDVVLARLRKHR